MKLETKLNNDESNNDEILNRIEALEQKINALTYNDVYKTIEKKHISLITSPIKKTNLIMKNVNFQYATKLWDYLQSHVDDDVKTEKKDQVITNDIKMKQYLDEIFLVGYLALKSMDESAEVKEEITEKLTGTMVQTMMELNSELTEEQLQNMVSEQYSKVKYLNIANEKEIRNKFKNSIDKYLDKIKNIKI